MKKKLVVAAILLVPPLVFYFFVFGGVQYVSRLPFYGPRIIEEKPWHGRTIQDTSYFEIPDFEMLRNDSTKIKSSELDGNIYLATFVDFGVLNEMPKELVFLIIDAFAEHSDLKVVTYFMNYKGQEISNPKSITSRFASDESNWIYVIETDTNMQVLHDDFYFVHDADLKVAKDPFSAVLIDKESRIRGYYNPIMAEDIKRAKEEVTHLKREYGLNYKTHKYFEYDKTIDQKIK